MDSVAIGKMGGALLFLAPASFLLYCFLHEEPKTSLLKKIKWGAIGLSIFSIILGFLILLG
jgi:hypothetical protein